MADGDPTYGASCWSLQRLIPHTTAAPWCCEGCHVDEEVRGFPAYGEIVFGEHWFGVCCNTASWYEDYWGQARG